ncbi:MAG: hypothetical protein WCX77_04195, partial [Candidatus Paceibacterota bacterium]
LCFCFVGAIRFEAFFGFGILYPIFGGLKIIQNNRRIFACIFGEFHILYSIKIYGRLPKTTIPALGGGPLVGL